MLTGEASSDERMDMVDRFQDREQDNFVLLISTMAGGVGLNLTAVGVVFCFILSWHGGLLNVPAGEQGDHF